MGIGMTESLREQWLERLKSGTVEQVHGVLRGAVDTCEDGGRCCIGVAADILVKNDLGEWIDEIFAPAKIRIFDLSLNIVDEDVDQHRQYDTELPGYLLEKFDITLDEQGFAIRLNDGFSFYNENEEFIEIPGFSFSKVAEFFEDPEHPKTFGNNPDLDKVLYAYLVKKGWVESDI
jgi:hypothetical protein